MPLISMALEPTSAAKPDSAAALQSPRNATTTANDLVPSLL